MVRWQPDPKSRLTGAAIELFAERGYDATTVAEIAEAAGLTKRTFFRHFSDKREVLFAGGAGLEVTMTEAALAAPPDASAMDAARHAVQAAVSALAPARDVARQRFAIVAGTPDLRERELIKMAHLADALRTALHERGVEEPTAGLCAEAGIAVFRIAFEQWVTAADDRPFADVVTAAFAELGSAAAQPVPTLER